MRISYGKLRVPLQRVAKRADGEYDVLACEVSIEVLGENFHAAYTEGDNSAVVATDTMKNFILRESLAYGGGTLEGLLEHLGRGFLATYPVMEAVRMTGREHRFDRLVGEAVRARGRRPRGRDGRARRGRDPRPPLRPRGHAAAEGHRQLVHPLRPRRVHDAARARRPPAADPHGRPLALRRPGRGPRRPVGGPRARRRDLRRLRQRVDPAPRARDGPADARHLAAARRGLLRRPRTTRATRRARPASASSTPTRSPRRA